MSVEKKPFGTLSDGKEVSLYTITNEGGESISVTDYGASVTSILVHDRDGNLRDIALGCDNAADYECQTACLGGVPGRVANRIEKGEFTLDGTVYHLECNDGPNHLHGGSHGFHRRLWQASIASENSVRFTLFSPDGEDGYPGNVVVSVQYTWNFTKKGYFNDRDKSVLDIWYKGMSDRDTPLNLTNHTYFNLNGHDSGSVGGHLLKIISDEFTENDANCLPTGRIVRLDEPEAKIMDFRTSKEIGRDWNEKNIHLQNGSGYDHNYVLLEEATYAAKAWTPESGILMVCTTEQPGLQLYAGNFLENSNIRGKGGVMYHNRDGFCLETQAFPNAMQHPSFPSVILEKGRCYDRLTTYEFSIADEDEMKF